jgi:hypothetical protein
MEMSQTLSLRTAKYEAIPNRKRLVGYRLLRCARNDGVDWLSFFEKTRENAAIFFLKNQVLENIFC